MKEFNVSTTSERSSLVVVRGAVQDNHLKNFGEILRHREIVVVTAGELEEANPMVGMALANGGESHLLEERFKQRRGCAEWVRSHVSENYGLQPLTYDVHLLDGADAIKDADGVDKDREHWQSVSKNMSTPEGEGSTLLWKYTPFSLEDSRVGTTTSEEDEPEFSEEERLSLLMSISSSQLTDAMQSNRLPVRFTYARAELNKDIDRRDLTAAHIKFDYPTEATFTRNEYPSDEVNSDGDRVLKTTTVSRRMYTPPVPPHFQKLIADAYAERNRIEEKAIERDGDQTMYIVADDGTTDYNMDAVLAPLHNLL